MNNYDTSILIDGCRELNITLTDLQTEQFVRFYEMVAEKNKFMNLTAITEWDEFVTKHFLDSLLVCDVFNLRSCNHVIDIGTGAGFPGIPLKIIYPEISMTLADSLKKRIDFIDDVVREIHLENINTVHARAEDLGRTADFRESYDLCVSRAVASLSSLSEYCLPLVKPDGYFISYKSNNIDMELKTSENAVRTLGGHLDNVKNISLPCSDIIRSFVVIKKVRHTPGKYPRKAGVPSRSPL